MNKGLIHIYKGTGKGKTSAAVGLCVRFCANESDCPPKTIFAQFLKPGGSGELSSLKKLGITVINPCDKIKFVMNMTAAEKAECERMQKGILDAIGKEAASSGRQLIVLDEVLDAASLGMIEENELIAFVKALPPETELVLTGREASVRLLELADYVSDIGCEKHPFDKGVGARKGIEF